MAEPKPTREAEAKLICGDCGKEVAAVKPRSNITRFLFRESRCNCIQKDIIQAQSVLKIGDTLNGHADLGSSQSDDKEFDKADVESRLDGQYEVISVLGKGGMGAVYLARHKATGKQFAIKLLNKDLDNSKPAQRRFSQESSAASRLTHPNLVAIYDYGVSKAGSSYLVMDYLEGTDLSTLLKRDGPLDEDRALPIFQQIAEALAHAHERGVVHRDIKPENIIITREGDLDIVKIVDFGIAKDITHERATQKLTQTGEIFGSPMYMSPEQCLGDEQDARSDIYALGCVMYEMVTGAPPFAAPNPVSVILKQVTEEPLPPKAVPPHQISPSLSAIIMRCLQKVPEERYQSASDVLSDLTKASSGVPVQFKTKNARPKSAKSNTLAVCAVVVVAVISAAFSFNHVRQSSQDEQQQSVEELLLLGNRFGCRYDSTPDFEKGRHYYQAAIDRGSVEAIYQMGRMIAEFADDDSGQQKAMEYFLLAYNKGSVDAAARLGIEASSEGKQDKAAQYYQEAIRRGDRYCYDKLAELYIRGVGGVPRDYAKAIKVLDEGIEKGAWCDHLMGYLYERGLGVPQSYKRAIVYYRAGVDHHAPGAAALGALYKSGLGVPADVKQAMRLFSLGIESMEARAYTELADMYAAGIGVKKDMDKAMELYSKGDLYGDLNASYKVVKAAERGEKLHDEVTPNLPLSERWQRFIKAVDRESMRGDEVACYLRGKLYAEGDHCKHDKALARKYLEMSASLKYKPAIDLMKKLGFKMDSN